MFGRERRRARRSRPTLHLSESGALLLKTEALRKLHRSRWGLGAWQRCWGSALRYSNSVLNRISWTRTALTCSFLVPDSRVVWRKALIWVMTLRKSADKKAKRKRAGKRGLRKHTRFTKAGTTTDGIVNGVMRSPERWCGSRNPLTSKLNLRRCYN